MFAAFYYVFFPLVVARTLTSRFDGKIFTGQYWAKEEEYLPFYRYRRSLMYLMAIAIPCAARRKFPGFDFRPHVGPAMVFAARFHVFAIAYAIVACIAIKLR